MKDYKVYILRETNSDIPRYVGITSGSLQNRLTKHIHDIKRISCKNRHKKNWLSKNLGNIVIEQIDTAETIDEMKNKEIYYISKFRNDGFELLNATNGGDGSYGFKHSEETIEKMSGKNSYWYGKKHSDEWIENAKKRIPHNKGAKTGLPSWNSGIPMTEEAKEKMRSKKIGQKDSEETRLKKSKSNKSYLKKLKVEALINDIWIEYPSIIEASIELGVNRTKIIAVCKGLRNHTGGYKFRYKNENI